MGSASRMGSTPILRVVICGGAPPHDESARASRTGRIQKRLIRNNLQWLSWYEKSGQSCREKCQTDHPIHIEERQVQPGKILRMNDGMLVSEKCPGNNHTEVIGHAQSGECAEADQQGSRQSVAHGRKAEGGPDPEPGRDCMQA